MAALDSRYKNENQYENHDKCLCVWDKELNTNF